MIGLGLGSCQEPSDLASMSPPPVSGAFRDACAQFATGVTIATVLAPDASAHGLTVSSFTSVSLDPPLVLFCVDHGSTVLPYFLESKHVAVNVLSQDQRDLSVAFSVKPEGRFEGVRWRGGPHGSPLIDDSLAQFECRVERIVEAGDHAIVIAEAVFAASNPGQPLLYFNRGYRLLE